MIETTDVGSDHNPKEILHRISEIWVIEPGEARWEEDEVLRSTAFEWWPGDFRVTARANRHLESTDNSIRLRVDTDFIRDFAQSNANKSSLLASVAHLFTSTYAFVYLPDAMLDAYEETFPEDFDPSRIWLASTAYVTPDTAAWLPGFFARMAVLQPINAQLNASTVAQLLKSEADVTPRPDNPQGTLDGILGVLDDVFIPIGREPSRWAGCAEFASFGETWGRSDNCFGVGDPTGLTLEVPFGDHSILIRLLTDQPHPQLGNGLLVTLQLPELNEDTAIHDLTSELNYLEATMWTGFPLLGCWHAVNVRDRPAAAFSMFVPNALYQPLIATNAAVWMVRRAAWMKSVYFKDLIDRPMIEILRRRAGEVS